MNHPSRRQFLGNAVAAAGVQSRPSDAGREPQRGPASLRVPVRVNHGNAAAPLAAGHDGYDWRPPELVVVSIPFARGAITADTPLTAHDAAGTALPTERTVLAKWPDGSPRWVQVRFASHADAQEWIPMSWDFEIRSGAVAPDPAAPVGVRHDGDRILIDNGHILLVVDPQRSGFGFAEVRVRDAGHSQAAGPQQLQILHLDGRRFDTEGLRATEVRIEESGRLRVVVSLSGRWPDAYDWHTRLTVVAGEPAIRAEYTIGGLGDREVDSVESISLRYPLSIGPEFHVRTAGSVIEFDAAVKAGNSVVLRQSAPAFSPPRDFYYEFAVESGGRSRIAARGGRSEGWLRCQGAALTAGVAVLDFAAKGPKEIRVSSQGEATLGLWPRGDILRFSRARAITHQVLHRFHPTVPKPNHGKTSKDYNAVIDQDVPYRACLRPLVAVVDPEYVCGTQAFGPYVSASASRLPELEKVLLDNFENWHRRHFDRWASYGMMHYGDYIAPFGGDNGGNPDRPHWRDHEWEFASVLFTHFIRRGDDRAYLFACSAYRHFLDVDVHHSRPFNFYHGYGDHGEMHEGYQGPHFGHTVVGGLADAYLLTGDRRALAAAERLAATQAAVFQQGDEAIVHKMFRTHVRDSAWAMLAMLKLYDVTGEESYLASADKGLDLIRRQPELWQKGGTWANAVFSAALETHHRLTGNPLARRLYLDTVNWLLDSYYIPGKNTLGPRPGGPAFHYGEGNASSGGALMVMASSLGYAYELTRERRYLAAALRLLREGMKTPEEVTALAQLPSKRRGYQAGVARSDGKWLSMLNFYTNSLPTAFRHLTPKQIGALAGER